jgi:hypothetical protein
VREAQWLSLGKRFQQCPNRSIVAKRLADVREPVDISGSEDEASTELKRILPQLVLMMAAGARALSRHGVLTSHKMQEIRGLQFRDVISVAGFVDKKGKGDARFFTKHSRIIPVA